MKKKLILIPLLILVLVATLAVGCAGESGIDGIDGEDGKDGEQGLQGIQGEQGAQGEVGLQGVAGARGQKGNAGAGATGEQGVQGETGLRGYTGAAGATGAPGVTPTFTIALNSYGDGQASSRIDTTTVYAGAYSVHLETLSTVGTGDEAQLVLTPLHPITLGEIHNISWYEYLVAGYPPSVAIKLDAGGDGSVDNVLVIEYGYNPAAHYAEAPMPYGALTGAWYRTFSDDGLGCAVVDDTSYAWLCPGVPGPPFGAWGAGGHYGDTLANWKAGLTAGTVTIDANTLVTSLTIKIDNWVNQTDVFVDSVVVNGVVVWQ